MGTRAEKRDFKKRSRGFARKEIKQIQVIVEGSQQELLERWNEYFND